MKNLNYLRMAFRQIRFLWNRSREVLWLRPLLACIISVAGAVGASLADGTGMKEWVPEINYGSIETLLEIMAASMLVIALLAVSSMVSAYNAASVNATPRAFRLVISDDLSQRALSSFMGAFIFSLVGIVSLKNSFYKEAGLFVLFVLTLCVFALVIFVFVSWVDRIARLGLLGTTIQQSDKATMASMEKWIKLPHMGGCRLTDTPAPTQEVFADEVGYVQTVDMPGLQAMADEHDLIVRVLALPGKLVSPDQLLFTVASGQAPDEEVTARLRKAFRIGKERLFDEDPRFGLVVLSQIAGRALSPGVNDPGTAIDVLGIFLRLFKEWDEGVRKSLNFEPIYPRIEVQELEQEDMLDDAFMGIQQYGAGMLEVSLRLQKVLGSLAAFGGPELQAGAKKRARHALASCEVALRLESDKELIRKAAEFATAESD